MNISKRLVVLSRELAICVVGVKAQAWLLTYDSGTNDDFDTVQV